MRFRTLAIDFDSTLVEAESLEMVCAKALAERSDADEIMREVQHITNLGMDGTIPFDESLSRRVALVAPKREHVEEVAKELRERITKSFLTNLDFLKANVEIAIVSHGFVELIEPAAQRVGIPKERIYAHTFKYDESRTVIGAEESSPVTGAHGKTRALEVSGLPRPLVMVGDGYTDAETKLLGAADVFIAFVEHVRREKATAHADVVAASFDDVRTYLEKGAA
jgi:D-3-phosphoglycerate dehydrogenase